ncbi:MAG: NADH:flavin oxidoreductase [Firmicutes bacterium]|nr:NADH:flavin oxidoreductase [Bacillota bacterium]
MADALFSSYRINKNVIPNRFTRSATAERCAEENGSVSEDLFVAYRKLAKGKIGLVITGHCYVHTSGKTNRLQNGFYDDVLIPGWSRLVEAFGEDNPDASIYAQLSHGGRQILPEINPNPIAPSAVPLEKLGSKPVEMTEGDISMIIESYIKAAVRARKIGFDGVQLHAAHGYLINQFLSPRTNLRKDKWGGNPENRMRFLVEIIKGIRAEIGRDYPVIVKINGSDYMPGGLKVEDTAEILKVIQEIGIDAAEISGGTVETDPKHHAIRKGVFKTSQEAYYLQEALKLLEVAKIPLLLAGGLRSVSVMKEVLKKGITAVSLSRPFICEPDLVLKIKSGEIRSKCTSCSWCYGRPINSIQCVSQKDSIVEY